jgi:hypothetical protein
MMKQEEQAAAAAFCNGCSVWGRAPGGARWLHGSVLHLIHRVRCLDAAAGVPCSVTLYLMMINIYCLLESRPYTGYSFVINAGHWCQERERIVNFESNQWIESSEMTRLDRVLVTLTAG